MAEIQRVVLFGKLGESAYKAVEGATVACKLRGNPYVELSHWLYQMLENQSSDIVGILRHFDCDLAKVLREISKSIESLPRGATSISDLSPHLEETVERAWTFSTLLFKEGKIRTGHILYTLIKSKQNVLKSISSELAGIDPDKLFKDFPDATKSSAEKGEYSNDGLSLSMGASVGEVSGALSAPQMGKGDGLKKFCVDLTEKARKGEIDPVLGRDEEIRQIVDILMRRRQNNPIITGEAGVGKTAIVEGFALKIAKGDVAPALRNVSLLSLDLGLLQAGASMKGEFENRLRQIIDEVQLSPTPIILFIDEAHTLIGAGGAEGQNDAANLLKPALARGTLRTIAATTWAEYKKYIEKDPALTRRFQVVKAEEPSVGNAILMMRGIAAVLKKHHNVMVLDEALQAAVTLSSRYIPARQLPDKAVSLIDTACARVAVSLHATPAAVEDSQRKIENINTEIGILKDENKSGYDRSETISVLKERLQKEEANFNKLNERWVSEKNLVNEILKLRGLNLNPNISDAEASEDAIKESSKNFEKLESLEAELALMQGESPLIYPVVDEQAVAGVVSDWTGIPLGRMVKDEIKNVLNIVDFLENRVLGQRHGLEVIAKRIQTSRAKLDNPSKPIGVFLLAGTSGVGKTETALALAEALYGGESNLITINMSEFQEAHTVSTLKGAPPGYVGYGEGGILTEAVRRKPYSVVLLDEVEKAHPDVHEIFFQVFDKGMMEDGEGRMIDFKNTIILLTTNAGSDLIMNMCKDPDLLPTPEGIADSLRDPLLKVFPAALLGRLVVVPYYPLSGEVMSKIINLQLSRVKTRIEANHKIDFSYTDVVVDLIATRCSQVESGGRMIDSILTQTLLPYISREILNSMMNGVCIGSVVVDVENDDFTYLIN